MATKILVVDDEMSVLAAWKRALKYGGYHVESALSADDALALVKERGFDVVILDFIMPKMTGLELLSEIRKHIPMIRSIIVSGKLDRDVDETTISEDLKRQLECDIYLHKPIDNRKLRSAVKELTEGNSKEDWKAIGDRIVNSKKKKAEVKKAEKKLQKIRKVKKKVK